MVGREVAQSRRTPRAPGAPLLILTKVTVTDPHGRAGLAAASLTVHAGEIVGIAGVSGNGQGALAGVIAGSVAPADGVVTLDGEALAATPRASIVAGIGRIPEDRHHEGIVGALSIAENLALETLRRRLPQVRRDARARTSRDPRLRRALSWTGYRDQAAFGRQHSEGDPRACVRAEPRVVLANQPTRGLDVGAISEVHRRLLEARERGVAIVLISEDLDELLALSDRVAVIARGALSSPLPVESVTKERLGLMMAGHAKAA